MRVGSVEADEIVQPEEELPLILADP